MQVNANVQVQIETLKKAIDQNKQVNNIMHQQVNIQKPQNNKENLVPKSKTIGNQFDQMV